MKNICKALVFGILVVSFSGAAVFAADGQTGDTTKSSSPCRKVNTSENGGNKSTDTGASSSTPAQSTAGSTSDNGSQKQ